MSRKNKLSNASTWEIIGYSLLVGPLLYMLAFAVECVVWCGDFFECRGPDNVWVGPRTCLMPIWTGDTFMSVSSVFFIAGIVIAVVYGITNSIQKAKIKREEKLKAAERAYEWQLNVEIREKLEKLANLGDAQATFDLGQWYVENGNNLKTALEWFEKAAAFGHQEAGRMKDDIQRKIERAKEAEEEEKKRNFQKTLKTYEQLKSMMGR